MPIAQLMVLFFATAISAYQAYNEYKKSKRKLGFYIWLSLTCGFLFWSVCDILDRDFSDKDRQEEIIITTESTSKKTQAVVQTAIDSTRQAILDSIIASKKDLMSRI